MLLDQFEAHGLGALLDTVYCGITTVADDVNLVFFSANEMQSISNVLSDYASKHRYNISSQKSCVLEFGKKDGHSLFLNGEKIQTTTSAKHLGIDKV